MLAPPNDFDEFFEADPDINHLNELYPDVENELSCRYYSSSEFKSSIVRCNTDLFVLHLNICSLVNKLDDLNVFLAQLDNCSFDIICITETWLDVDSPFDMYQIPNYTPFHLCRDGRGGGVSVYVRSCFIANKLDNLCGVTPDIEYMFISCSMHNKRIAVGTIYRPPARDTEVFLNTLDNMLSNISGFNEVIILGDFNLNLLNTETNTMASNFLNMMNSHFLIPTITKPTRIDANSSTLIDNIFICKPNSFSSGNINSDLSDHMVNFLQHKKFFDSAGNLSSSYNRSYRLINGTSLQNLYDGIAMHNFASIINATEVDDAIRRLYDIIFYYYNVNCPIKVKTVSYKQKLKPWISESILGDIRKRQSFSLLCKRGVISRANFNRFRNYVTSRIRDARKNYYELKFAQCKNDMKKTWRLINNIIKPGYRLNKQSIAKIIDDEVELSDPMHIAEKMNFEFANVGRKIAESCEQVDESFLHWLRGDFSSSFFYRPITSFDIQRILLSLKNKSCALEVVPVRVFKFISDVISPILCLLVNRSVMKGVFPDSLKVARVVPVYKSGDRTSAGNYRPISVLPTLSKVFERVIHEQLYKYFERKGIFYPFQFGFRRNKGTVQSCTGLLRYLYDSLDNERSCNVNIFRF